MKQIPSPEKAGAWLVLALALWLIAALLKR